MNFLQHHSSYVSTVCPGLSLVGWLINLLIRQKFGYIFSAFYPHKFFPLFNVKCLTHSKSFSPSLLVNNFIFKSFLFFLHFNISSQEKPKHSFARVFPHPNIQFQSLNSIFHKTLGYREFGQDFWQCRTTLHACHFHLSSHYNCLYHKSFCEILFRIS